MTGGAVAPSQPCVRSRLADQDSGDLRTFKSARDDSPVTQTDEAVTIVGVSNLIEAPTPREPDGSRFEARDHRSPFRMSSQPNKVPGMSMART